MHVYIVSDTINGMCEVVETIIFSCGVSKTDYSSFKKISSGIMSCI
jgi:hypothetical protein